MPAFLTPDAMDAWLEPVKLDRGGRENMLAELDGSSADVSGSAAASGGARGDRA